MDQRRFLTLHDAVRHRPLVFRQSSRQCFETRLDVKRRSVTAAPDEISGYREVKNSADWVFGNSTGWR